MKPTRILLIILLAAFPAILSLQGCNNNGDNGTVTGADSTTGPHNAEYNNGNVQDSAGTGNYNDSGSNGANTNGTNNGANGSNMQNGANGSSSNTQGSSGGRKEVLQPSGSTFGAGSNNYSPSAGFIPDTSAPGTRKGNTYKSGRTGGQYGRVIKPWTDTSKHGQLHK